MTGTISLELLKIECGLKKIESYRSCFANLSMPMFCFTEPGPCQYYICNEKEYSEWDHIIIPKSANVQTIGDLCTYVDNLMKVETTMVNVGDKLLFMNFGAPVGNVNDDLMCRLHWRKRSKKD